MKIRSITPIRVSAEEVQRRQSRYDKLMPEGWTLRLENLPASAESPEQLGSPEDIFASERIGLLMGQTTKPEEFDVLLPDCVLDPALQILDSIASVPALGITRLSAYFLAACGLKFGVITRNKAIGDAYLAVIQSYGLEKYFDQVHVLNLSVEDIADDVKWNDAVEVVARKAAANETSILINGCSAVEVSTHAGKVTIIDPTALALRVAELAFNLNLLCTRQHS